LTLWTGFDHPLTPPELHEYLAAVRDARRAVEQARAALAKAYRRPQEQSVREAR
jgi:hypothetical protein